MKPILRPSMKQEVANMNDALAQMQRSGSIYFLKSLPKTAIRKGDPYGKYAELTLPVHFVQGHSDKIEEWVILRAQLSRGKSSRPWLVKLRVDKTALVCIALGWHSFVVGNGLKQGDSLIFLLKEDFRSEFEVHLFRGPQGSPYFPDEGENSRIDEEESAKYVSDSEKESAKYISDSEKESEEYHVTSDSEEETYSPSPSHHEAELNKAFIKKFRNGKAAPFPHTKPLEKHRTYPGFRKRLTASSITGSNGDSNSGQFDFPWSFVKTHGNQVHGSVKLQGIHEDSPTYSVTCRRRPQHSLRVSFNSTEWSRFVKENGLKNGHELQFSLIDESYFVVRKV